MKNPYGLESLSYEWAVEKAKRFNCDIVIADDSTLQIDLDSDEALEVFDRQHLLLCDLGLLPSFNYEQSESKGGNTHITIPLGFSLSVEQRLLLQALLGSDLKREALSLKRVREGMPNPILLFKPRTETPDAADDDLPF